MAGILARRTNPTTTKLKRMKLLLTALCASFMVAPAFAGKCEGGKCDKEKEESTILAGKCDKDCDKDKEEDTVLAGKCDKDCDEDKDEDTVLA